MPWFKVDDKFHSHPKVMELPLGAIGLWTLAGTWSADYLTDGEIRLGQIRRLGGTEDDAAELVKAGLWESTEDGYKFRDWHDYQPTRESVESEREAAKERQRRRREQRPKKQPKRDEQQSNTQSDGSSVTHASRRDTDVSHAPVTEEFSTPVPVPVPEVPKGTKRVKRAKPKVPLPDDWEPTEAHRAKARKLSLDPHFEAEKFRTFHESKDNRYADWDKAFHTWLTRATEFGTAQQAPRLTAAERELRIGAERDQRIASGQLAISQRPSEAELFGSQPELEQGTG